MKKIITLFTAAVLLTGAAACGKTTETIDYINPHSELWSIRYDTDSTADMEIDFSKKDGGQVQNVKKSICSPLRGTLCTEKRSITPLWNS